MPTPRLRAACAAVLGAALLGLAACTPTPSPSGSAGAGPEPSSSPSPSEPAAEAPALDALALSADGLGTLVFGQAPGTGPDAMLVHDPRACTDEVTGEPLGIAEGDPGAALWLPIEAYRPSGSPYGYFGVLVDDASGTLTRIDLFDATIPTDEGIRVGDARADAEAAYPGATVVEEWGTDILVVSDPHGTLQIEIARQPSDMTYWDAAMLDTVVYIHAAATGVAPFTVAASENVVGICNFA